MPDLYILKLRDKGTKQNLSSNQETSLVHNFS